MFTDDSNFRCNEITNRGHAANSAARSAHSRDVVCRAKNRDQEFESDPHLQDPEKIPHDRQQQGNQALRLRNLGPVEDRPDRYYQAYEKVQRIKNFRVSRRQDLLETKIQQ